MTKAIEISNYRQIKKNIDEFGYVIIKNVYKKRDLDNLKKRIEDELEAAKIEAIKIINRSKSEAKIISNEIELRKTFAEQDEETWKVALKETSKGFPTL